MSNNEDSTHTDDRAGTVSIRETDNAQQLDTASNDDQNNDSPEVSGHTDEVNDLKDTAKKSIEDKEEKEEEEDDDDEEEYGPLPQQPRAKKFKPMTNADKRLKDETDAKAMLLPRAHSYTVSYMHRKTVTHVCISDSCEFVITASADGMLKFWKRHKQSIEFVKTYRAHIGPVQSMSLNANGAYLCSVGQTDRALKIWNVLDFDLIYKHDLKFMPLTCCFVSSGEVIDSHVAVSERGSNQVHVLSALPTGADKEEVFSGKRHKGDNIHIIKSHPSGKFIISTDMTGSIEYWRLNVDGTFSPANNKTVSSSDSSSFSLAFEFKSETDLYELQKAKTTALAMDISSNGKLMAFLCDDHFVRIFKVASGKLFKVLDESIETQLSQNNDDTLKDITRIPSSEFEKKYAAEPDYFARLCENIRSTQPPMQKPSIKFSSDGAFLYYPVLSGIKVINVHFNTVVRIVGREEYGLKLLSFDVSQAPRKDSRLVGVAGMNKPGSNETPQQMLVATALNSLRFYVFLQSEGIMDSQRDIINEAVPQERPTQTDSSALTRKDSESVVSGTKMVSSNPNLLRHAARATVHTTFGDIKLRLYPEECPRTVENFVVHAQQGYYDNVIFHRVIKGFMIQTGDPRGDGTGGESIWGGEFDDEFSYKLRHDQPYTVSMANAGPNTNGSQFFITTATTPFLDNKHTVFGRVEEGMNVVHEIENARTNVEDRPWKDIKILTIRVSS